MKIKNSPEQIAAIVAALKPLHVKLFCHESGNPKYNAQRNLSGRTHYVDDDTLRWHHSRVLGSSHEAQGLLFCLTTSDALDMHNTKRGYRGVVFDVFGTTVYRPDLEHAFTTTKAAQKARSEAEIDLVAHYRQAIANKLESAKREVENILKSYVALDAAEFQQPVNA
jgi:hypothetical protein